MKRNNMTYKHYTAAAKKNNTSKAPVVAILAIIILAVAGTAFVISGKTTAAAKSAPVVERTSDFVEESKKSEVEESETDTVDTEEEEETSAPEIEKSFYEGKFELPVEGSTGWASVELNCKSEPNSSSDTVAKFVPGTAFVITAEVEGWFKVENNGVEGFVESNTVLVNLPDIIPSIVYEDTNSVSSMFKSSGVELDGISGEQLYDVYNWSNRFDGNQFDMPVLYPMASKIMNAQKAARASGRSLKIYETYRPNEVQRGVSGALNTLKNVNPVVANGLDPENWDMSWFIATKVSNHQRGYAIDVSLVEITSEVEKTTGMYKYIAVDEYTELEMPTAMHELSAAAVRYTSPYSKSFAKTMNQNAIDLHDICVGAGLSPLQSEWWHFNDEALKGSQSDGCYFLAPNCSVEPSI